MRMLSAASLGLLSFTVGAQQIVSQNTVSDIKTLSGCTCRPTTEVVFVDAKGQPGGGGFSHSGCGTGPYEKYSPGAGRNWCDTIEPSCNGGQGWDLCSAPTQAAVKPVLQLKPTPVLPTGNLAPAKTVAVIHPELHRGQEQAMAVEVPLSSLGPVSYPTLPQSTIKTASGCTCQPFSEVILIENGQRIGGGMSHEGCSTGQYEQHSPGNGRPWCDVVESWCNGGQGWDLCTPPAASFQSGFPTYGDGYPPMFGDENSFSMMSAQPVGENTGSPYPGNLPTGPFSPDSPFMGPHDPAAEYPGYYDASIPNGTPHYPQTPNGAQQHYGDPRAYDQYGQPLRSYPQAYDRYGRPIPAPSAQGHRSNGRRPSRGDSRGGQSSRGRQRYYYDDYYYEEEEGGGLDPMTLMLLTGGLGGGAGLGGLDPSMMMMLAGGGGTMDPMTMMMLGGGGGAGLFGGLAAGGAAGGVDPLTMMLLSGAMAVEVDESGLSSRVGETGASEDISPASLVKEDEETTAVSDP